MCSSDLVAYRLSEPGTLSLKDKAGVETPLVFGTDFTRSGDALKAETQLSAGLVFAGYGLVAPEHKRDDYKGLDAKGKIVVLLEGAPKFLQTEERAYYGNRVEKLRVAQAHGAVGVVVVRTLTSDRLRPFFASLPSDEPLQTMSPARQVPRPRLPRPLMCSVVSTTFSLRRAFFIRAHSLIRMRMPLPRRLQ